MLWKPLNGLKKAAEKGVCISEINLGICYQDGIGVEKNERLAFGLYSKAVAQGDAYAKRCLGKCYQTGIGVDKDEEMAFKLFVKQPLRVVPMRWKVLAGVILTVSV